MPPAAPAPDDLTTQLAQLVPLLTQLVGGAGKSQAEDLDEEWEYEDDPEQDVLDEARAGRSRRRRRRPGHHRRTGSHRGGGYFPIGTYAGWPPVSSVQQQVLPYQPDGAAAQLAALMPVLSQIAQGQLAPGQVPAGQLPEPPPDRGCDAGCDRVATSCRMEEFTRSSTKSGK